MFLIMGISEGEKKLDFNQMIICPCCGGYGRLEIYMTYSVFSLFFIPLIKWNKHFFIKTTCCGAGYELDRELGLAVQHGEITELSPEDLHFACGRDHTKRCANCGYATDEDFQFCPKCGSAL